MNGSLLTREEVHCLVWNRPAMLVAALFGISGGSLARSCRRRGIPMPGRTYWQRVKAGHVLARLPLEPVETELPMPWACTPEVERLLAELGMPRLRPLTGNQGSCPAVIEPPAKRAAINIAETPSEGAPMAAAAAVASPSSRAAAHDLWQRDDAPIDTAIAWLTQEREHASLDRLCVQLQNMADMQPAAVRSAMQAWVAIVREQMDAARPIAGFISLCNRLVEGREVRAWWPGRQA